MLGNEEEKQKMADNVEGDKCQNSEENAVNPDEIIDDSEMEDNQDVEESEVTVDENNEKGKPCLIPELQAKSCNIGVAVPTKLQIDAKTFSERYRMLREEKNISNDKVAARIKELSEEEKRVDALKQSLWKVEQGKSKSEWLCRGAAKVFGVSAEYLGGQVDCPRVVRTNNDDTIERSDILLFEPIIVSGRPSDKVKEEQRKKEQVTIQEFIEKEDGLVNTQGNNEKVESIYSDIFYHIAHAELEEQKNFIKCWKLQKKYTDNPEQLTPDEQKKFKRRLTFHKKTSLAGEHKYHVIWDLIFSNEELFEVLYEIASDSLNNKEQLRDMMIRNYEYTKKQFQ